MASAARVNSRYEMLEVLGEGGMGVVYRAYDSFLRREVALKTVRDFRDQTALDLFKKEVDVLAGLSHPNIVEIFDVGEISESTGKRPYFVMPLLRGVTLDKLIKSASQRLTVARCVDIMSQVCRGLQAAHDAGLVHRDLKPSNLFILEDDSVKIIDFGIAHLLDAQSTAGMKGTLLYMSPEQLMMKRPSPLSDVFAAGVVCFVAMARRHPFEGLSLDEMPDAIVNRIPTPASDFNPAITASLSQVIHKAMAKQPFQRFASAREFSDNLQKALRNEPIECFNPEKIEARVQRAKKAFEEDQLGIACDILGELEAEACLHPEIAPLRKRIDQVQKDRTIAQLLDTARRCFEGQEYQLALQKVQEVLNLDNTNTAARSLQGEIENKRSSDQIEDWCRIALQHAENHSYDHARNALQNVLKLKPKDTRAQQLLADVDRREQEYNRLRQEKEQYYQAALKAMESGELSSALTKLERVLDMDRRAPDTLAPDRASMYQKLYNEVRSKHDVLDRGYAEARRNVENGNFAAALATCAEFLEKYPEHAMFRSLRLDAEERQRQEISAYVARVSREVEAEADIDRRIVMLEQALEKHPDEPQFTRLLHNNHTKRDLVEGIVAKARSYESAGQYNEALDQWRILRDIYRQYPGLDFEADRVQKRKEQKERSDAKTRWVEQIDQALNVRDFPRAVDLCANALAEFPNDAELVALERSSQQGFERMRDSHRMLEEALALLKSGERAAALQLLREASQIEPANSSAKSTLVDALIAEAREQLERDWRAAEQPVQEVTELDPGNARAKSLRMLISDKKQEEYVAEILSRARELKEAGHLEDALAVIEDALKTYPKNQQLAQRRTAIQQNIQEAARQQVLKQDLNRAQELGRKADQATDILALRSIFDESVVLAKRYPGDANFETLVYDVRHKLQDWEQHLAPAPDPKAHDKPKSSAPAAAEKPHVVAPEPRQGADRPRPEAKQDAKQDARHDVRPRVQPIRPPRGGGIKQLAGLAAAVVVGLFLMAVYSVVQDRRSTSRDRVAVASGPLELKLSPANANFEIFNKDRKSVTQLRDQLPFGTYFVSVNAPGYLPVEQEVQFQGAPVTIALRPLTQALELFADVEGLTVTLDGQPMQASGGGQYAANDLSEDQHTITMSTPGGQTASLTFAAHKGALPEIVNFTSDRTMRPVAVLSFGGTAKVFKPVGTRDKVSVAWNGEAPEEIGDEGVTRTGLASQEHSIALVHGADRRDQVVSLNPGSKLAVFLTDQNVGTLLIDAGYPDVTVEINSRARQGRKMSGGRIALGLVPNDYLVRITKEGFYPEEQKLTVRRGETQTFKATLREVPKNGRLVVKHGSGVQISVGDGPWQSLGGDGETSVQTPLGSQRVRLRKAGFRDWEGTREFSPDSPETLDVGEIKFVQAEAVVTFKVTPAETRIHLTGPDGKDIPVSGHTASLRDGKYQATGTAGPEFDPANVTFEVTGGRAREVEIALKHKIVTPKADTVAGPMDGWRPQDWKLADGGWYERTSKGSAFFSGRNTGTIEFVVQPADRFLGGNRFHVLLDYRDAQNYIDLEVHRNKVVFTERKAGKKVNEKTASHNVRFGESVRVKLTLAPTTAVLSLANGAAWTQVYSHTGNALDTGRLGLDGVRAITEFKRSSD